jgi:tetratricopeptide (TPR) repeat protein
MLTKEDLSLGHRLAGDWLEARGEQDATTLAEHFDKGGASEAAARWYERAAEQALDANDMDAAVARAERGIACGAAREQRARLRALQAEARLWSGDYAGAEIAGLEAMKLLPQGASAWFDAAGWVGTAAGPLGHKDRLIAIAGELHALGSAQIERASVVAIARTTMQMINIAEYGLSDRLLTLLASPSAEALRREPNVAGLIDQVRAAREMARGDAGSSLALTQSAVASFEQAGNLRDACYERLGVVLVYMALGAWTEAAKELNDLGAIADRYALTRVSAMVKHNLGYVHGYLGLPDAADLEREAIAALDGQGDLRLSGCSYVYLAHILMMAGDLRGAEEAARTAIAAVPHVPPILCFATGMLANVLLLQGRSSEALENITAAVKLLNELGTIEEGEAQIRLVHATATHAVRGVDAARALINDARNRLLARAEKITDLRWRQSFLANIPHHARTLELAAAWAGAS